MIKQCEYCGKQFNARSDRERICNFEHTSKCPICGKERILSKEQARYVLEHGESACSYECRVKRTQQTSIEKYGCKAPGNNPEARIKASQTMLKNLGVPYAMMNTHVKAKSIETNLMKYGVDNAGKSQEIIEKRKQTNAEKYGEVMPFNRPECYDKQHEILMQKYGVKYGYLVRNSFLNRVSHINKAFASKLSSHGIKSEFEKCIEGRYYDIEIIGRNILIEIDPTYTHSSVNRYNLEGLDRNYHDYKTMLANQNGYRCIHVWDWDSQNKIISQLLPRTIIHASECSIYKLTDIAAKHFIDVNGLQSCPKGQMLHVGLVKDDKIYAVISFGKSIYSNEYQAQIYSICTRIGYDVQEGYDAISTAASRDFGIHSCIAYIDRSKQFDENNICENIGMKHYKKIAPQLIWSKNTKFISDKYVRTPEQQDELLSTGWLPIYNCGKDVYVFK